MGKPSPCPSKAWITRMPRDALSTTGGVRDRRGKTKICGLVERERVGNAEFARYREKGTKGNNTTHTLRRGRGGLGYPRIS